MRHARKRIPFGEQLITARLENEMSRAELARQSGISENSLVRYEKSGLDQDGQYPPGPKLAKLCMVLGISPLRALSGCLEGEDYWEFETTTSEDFVIGHPSTDYLDEQYIALLKDNRILVKGIETLLAPTPETASHEEENLTWMKGELSSLTYRYNTFLERMEDKFSMSAFEPMVLMTGNSSSDFIDVRVTGTKNDFDKDGKKKEMSPEGGNQLGSDI